MAFYTSITYRKTQKILDLNLQYKIYYYILTYNSKIILYICNKPNSKFNQNLLKMKKHLLILTIMLAITSLVNAQKIDIEKVLGGYKYTHNDELISIGDLASIMKSNTNAFELIKKGRTNRSLSGVLGFVGGGLVGWPLGTAIAGGKENWTLAGIGAGLIIVSIPISLSSNKKINQAVELYNASLNATSNTTFKPEFKIIANGSGFGLTMNF